MPEAAIDEDGDSRPAKHEIGSSAQRWLRLNVYAVSQSEGVERPSKLQLWLCVPSGMRAHPS